MVQSLKVQLTEAATELKVVKEASVTSEFVSGIAVGPRYGLSIIFWYKNLPNSS